MLKGKHILLGVTGAIAAYKAARRRPCHYDKERAADHISGCF